MCAGGLECSVATTPPRLGGQGKGMGKGVLACHHAAKARWAGAGKEAHAGSSNSSCSGHTPWSPSRAAAGAEQTQRRRVSAVGASLNVH